MALANAPLRRSARHLKKNLQVDGRSSSSSSSNSPRLRSTPSPSVLPEPAIKQEPGPPPSSTASGKTKAKKAKTVDPSQAAALLQERKLKFFATHLDTSSPFPSFAHPTPQECSLIHRVLAAQHGPRLRPDIVVAPASASGCGNSPSVLDALVRTILSQNTSDRNSSRAKLGMDAAYGRCDDWDAIVGGGQARLQGAIQSGGLAVVKSRVILGLLAQVRERYGAYSLDHLFHASNVDAMRELLSYRGVGPKTASCVLMFCMCRESFAVDTHVYRLTGLLGWRPPGASREEAQAHLNATIPDEHKYGLHVLLVTHGKVCAECRAGGKSLGKCSMRRAAKKGVEKGEAKMEMPSQGSPIHGA
ncbi:Endonuclease III [Escovopsis weberi]|uniref:Endonuclease III n=1 Tax=Escovopsis weberi TaxID=150374 RepID=A0A0M9VSK7_ESCWE|nr:Endonuclease III [Escovopsis weberi]